MKTMTCRQLGGVCDIKFQSNTFEEMSELSKKHGMEMFQKGDEEHINKMNEMKEMMTDPGAIKTFMDGMRKKFEALPADG